METLAVRIVRRGVPVAIATGLIGFLLSQGYLIAEWMGAEVTRDPSSSYLGPVLFALFGFATVAALECVRKVKPKADALAVQR